MAFEIQHQLEHWRLRAQSSGAGQFLRWWKAELMQLLPAETRARMQHASRRLMVSVGNGELALSSLEGGQLQMLDVFDLSGNARVQQQQIADLLLERDLHDMPRDLLLPDEAVLRKTIQLPIAAESNLRQALAFEMDRHTPFKASDLYFDYRILSRDREAGQTRLELIAIPRGPVDRMLEALAGRGLSPSGVDVAADGMPAGLNLLPPDRRHRVANRRARANGLLALVVAALLALVMMQSLWLREHQIEAVQDAIETVSAEARVVQGLRKQIEDASEAASFLQDRRAENPPTVAIIAEVTRVLPDDTYLDRLRIWEGNVQLQGKSSNAQQLIETLNESPLFDNASFRGPTRLDTRTRKEIFDLVTTLTPGESS